MGLNGYNCDVREASTGEEALAIMASNAFDVSFIDLRLPDVSGIHLLAIARDRQYAIGLSVIITGEPNPSTPDDAKVLGAKFLAKPMNLADIRRIIQEAVPDAMATRSSVVLPERPEMVNGAEALGSAKRRRLLVLDDNDTWLGLMKNVLGKDFSLELTTNPEKAIAAVAAEHYDLVILDMRLPGTSGLEVLKRMQESAPDVRAVILTEYDNLKHATAAGRRGALGYIKKHGETLARTINEILDEDARPLKPPELILQSVLRGRIRSLFNDESDQAVSGVDRRIRLSEGGDEEYVADALSALRGWVGEEPGSLVFVRGEGGIGKTVTLRELARQLADDEDGPVPVFIQLGDFDRPPTMDVLLTKYLTELGVDRIDLVAARELVRQGRLVLLLDGVDELIGRLAEQGRNAIGQIVRDAGGKAKVVICGRELQITPDAIQHISRTVDHSTQRLHSCTLLPLSREQVYEFLKIRAGKPYADTWMNVMELPDLESIAANPLMLHVIAEIGSDTIFNRPSENGSSIAEVYRLLLPRWFAAETSSSNAADDVREARWALMTALSARIWQSEDSAVTGEDILGESQKTIRTGIDSGALAQSVMASAFLYRDATGGFSLKHRSVLEWLVANAAADELRQGLAPEILKAAPVTESAYRFMVALAGPEACVAWARRVSADNTDQFEPHARTLSSRLLEAFANDEKAKGWTPSFGWLDWLNGAGDLSLVARLDPACFRSPALCLRAFRVRNIRGFADTGIIDLCDPETGEPRSATLLLGDNAAGKSTLLQCAVAAFLGPELAGHLISAKLLLRHNARSGYIEAIFDLDDRISQDSGTFFVGIELRAGIDAFFAADPADCTLIGEAGNMQNAADRLDKIRKFDGGAFGSLFAYGPWRTLNVEPNQSRRPETTVVLDRVASVFHSEMMLVDPKLLEQALKGDLKEIGVRPDAQADSLAKLVELTRALLPGSTYENPGEASFAIHGAPLDVRSLSDGYSSILAMMGHMFRNIVQATAPDDGKTMILIDEVDLHLHPTWQRRVATDLARAFPQAQIIYSSHSPMVAGAAPPDSIVVLKREGDHIDVESDVATVPRVRGWRADQILTSPLFDLDSSRDIETTGLIERYTDLAVATSLSAEDQLTLRALAAELNLRLPTAAETVQARKAFELIEMACNAQIDALGIDEKKRVVRELKAQLVESVTQSRRPS
jgi:ActR/RegA family two-component response regulator